MNTQKKYHIAVAMSGGLDSTMAAALLLKQGHSLVGFTMQIGQGSLASSSNHARRGCFGTAAENTLQQAQMVARHLNIPHHVIPLQNEFKNEVISYFRNEYLAGRTPNPCMHCNQRLKFGLLPAKARAMGYDFDFYATGHYARVEHQPAPQPCRLLRGRDPAKDQSYFLAFLTQNQLRQTIFPLGTMLKSEVKKLASELGLEKHIAPKESQDFFEGDDYTELFHPAELQPGPIVNRAGHVLGHHKGLAHYTLGQRRGLNLGGGSKHPLHVTALDASNNTVVVGTHAELLSHHLWATQINWIGMAPPNKPFHAAVRIRQQHRAAAAILTPVDVAGEPAIAAHFEQAQMAITPGQAAVFYQDDLVLGGGVITARPRP